MQVCTRDITGFTIVVVCGQERVCVRVYICACVYECARSRVVCACACTYGLVPLLVFSKTLRATPVMT